MNYNLRRPSEGGTTGWLYAHAANLIENLIWPLERTESWLDERGYQATKRWETKQQQR